MELLSAKYWEDEFLVTHNGIQCARRFVHPERDPGFPNMFLLPEPHPLRPPFFTSENHPRAGRSFRDYVLTVHKDEAFMNRWTEAGSKATTPLGDDSTNLGNGMCVPYLPHRPKLLSTRDI